MTIDTWVYRFRGNLQSDGGTVLIDSTGLFMSHTPYGDYGYRWTHTGLPIRQFIAQLHDDYMYSKFMSGRSDREHFDGAATMRAVRAEIFKDGNEELRASELDILEDFFGSEFNDEHDWHLWLGRTSLDEPWTHQKSR